jgi:uncharacterized protein (UPF0332 family)
MSYVKDLVDCEHKALLKKVLSNPDITSNEISASDYDLNSAKRDYSFDDYKWATIKAYYSMYHMASAVARSRGYVIENHQCMYLFLGKLVERGELESRFAAGFKGMIVTRKQADYNLTYSKVTADESIQVADAFHKRLKQCL